MLDFPLLPHPDIGSQRGGPSSDCIDYSNLEAPELSVYYNINLC